jgi:hypothetical protein
MPINASSLTKRLTDCSKRLGVTAGLLFVLRLLRDLWCLLWWLAASLVLLAWIALDLIPSLRSKHLTYPTPIRRRLPLLYSEGSDIFAEMPDGTVLALEPLEAKLYAESCFQVVAGSFVYEKTRIKLDADD